MYCDILNTGLENVSDAAVLNPSVHQSCLTSGPRTIACYIFCSRFPFSHAALGCFKIAPSAHSCEPRWSILQSSRAHRECGRALQHKGRSGWKEEVHIQGHLSQADFYPAHLPLACSTDFSTADLFRHFYQMLFFSSDFSFNIKKNFRRVILGTQHLIPL